MTTYTLNSVNLTTYGIVPGHATGSNIAMAGIFDCPVRIGQTHYEWADDDSVEPYTLADELFFAGRDIFFHGAILGTNKQVNDYLEALYDAVEAFTGLVTLVTPYGSFSVQVKTIVPEFYIGGCKLVMTFREPVVTLDSGSLPSTGSSAYTIDLIPMTSFGLYYSKGSGMRSLSELKEQLYTKYGAEGYQMTRRKARNFGIHAFVMGTSLSDFQTKIAALYKCFASAGMRSIIINNEIEIECFSVEGFKVSDIHLFSNGMIANFDMNLIPTSVSLYTADTTIITADEGVITVDVA
jgi:hypothetical protein